VAINLFLISMQMREKK